MHDDDLDFFGLAEPADPLDDWAAWWRGDSLRPEPPRTPEDVEAEIAMCISHWLERPIAQVDFAKSLRGYHNHITDYFADLLEPGGRDGWKLILKRSGRGRAHNEDPGLVLHCYYQAIETGKRGAVKRLAKSLNTTTTAARSLISRIMGRHGKRGKRKGGRHA